MGNFFARLFGPGPPHVLPRTNADIVVTSSSSSAVATDHTKIPIRHRPTTLSSAFENELNYVI